MVTEFKIKMMKDGFIFTERIVPNTPAISIIIEKFDTDGLRYSASCAMDLISYGNAGAQYNILYDTYNNVMTASNKRHAQNISQCEHTPVRIGNDKRCLFCMAHLGIWIDVQLDHN